MTVGSNSTTHRSSISTHHLVLLEVLLMRFRQVVLFVLCAIVLSSALPRSSAFGQAAQQSGLSVSQRIDVVRSRIETTRRTLNSAIAGLNSKDDGKKDAADSPRARLSDD